MVSAHPLSSNDDRLRDMGIPLFRFQDLSLMESLPFWTLDGNTLDPSELDRQDFGRDGL